MFPIQFYLGVYRFLVSTLCSNSLYFIRRWLLAWSRLDSRQTTLVHPQSFGTDNRLHNYGLMIPSTVVQTDHSHHLVGRGARKRGGYRSDSGLSFGNQTVVQWAFPYWEREQVWVGWRWSEVTVVSQCLTRLFRAVWAMWSRTPQTIAHGLNLPWFWSVLITICFVCSAGKCSSFNLQVVLWCLKGRYWLCRSFLGSWSMRCIHILMQRHTVTRNIERQSMVIYHKY